MCSLERSESDVSCELGLESDVSCELGFESEGSGVLSFGSVSRLGLELGATFSASTVIDPLFKCSSFRISC